LRPSAPVASPSLLNAAARSRFSTSPALNVNPPKKVKAAKAPLKNTKGTKTLRIKKKAIVKTGKPPAPGERKALRKRIVLTNPNALEVANMTDLSADIIADKEFIGKVVGIPGPVVDQLRVVEAFKTTQGWNLFRRPGTLVREESVELAQLLQAAEEGKKTTVKVIDGVKNSGKSLMLLQAMAAAFTKGWIVISIPDGMFSSSSAPHRC
jgi:small subunit ribosomal protein S29